MGLGTGDGRRFQHWFEDLIAESKCFSILLLSQVRNLLLACLQTLVKKLLSVRVYFLSFELFSGHGGQTFKEAMISLEYQLTCWKSPIHNGSCQAGVLCTWSVCSILRRPQLPALRNMDSVWKLITLPPGDAPSRRNRFKERRFDSLKTNLKSHLRLCQDWCYYKRRETVNNLISWCCGAVCSWRLCSLWQSLTPSLQFFTLCFSYWRW